MWMRDTVSYSANCREDIRILIQYCSDFVLVKFDLGFTVRMRDDKVGELYFNVQFLVVECR